MDQDRIVFALTERQKTLDTDLMTMMVTQNSITDRAWNALARRVHQQHNVQADQSPKE